MHELANSETETKTKNQLERAPLNCVANLTNETQKRTNGEKEKGRLRTRIEIPKLPEKGKNMNEETKPETKDQPQPKDQQETPKPELLVLKTGYGQHASLSLRERVNESIKL